MSSSATAPPPPRPPEQPPQHRRQSRPHRQKSKIPRHQQHQNRPPISAPPPPAKRPTPLHTLLRAACIACGIQFGWALQLSLLTPYVQELGIPHTWAGLVWLCGPIAGLVVQPLVGHASDRSKSRFGRRRPFVVAGAVVITLGIFLIAFSADIGGLLGDPTELGTSRPRAIVVFVIGFWMLDVGNNATQSPCRALLGDLSGKDHRRTRIANAYYSLFMALGNILGYAAGSYSGWFSIFSFTVTSSCFTNCANLKSVFLLDIILLIITTCVSIFTVKEIPLCSEERSGDSAGEMCEPSEHAQEPFLWEFLGSFKYLTYPIWMILIVTALTWIGWFPFNLYDTDWMGREVYRGDPNTGQNYHSGVRMGSLGLMLNSVLLGLTSMVLEKLCRKWGAALIWGISNIIMAFCFAGMLIITLVAKSAEFSSSGLPPASIIAACLIVFTVLGVPLSVTYTIPYAMISSRTENLGLGQGLAMGILNLAIVIPQVVVSLGSGPLDQLFGGGNSPAFAVAALSTFVGGLLAIVAIPRSSLARTRSLK